MGHCVSGPGLRRAAFRWRNGSVVAEFRFRIYGTKGRGYVDVHEVRDSGIWVVTQAVLRFDGDRNVVAIPPADIWPRPSEPTTGALVKSAGSRTGMANVRHAIPRWGLWCMVAVGLISLPLYVPLVKCAFAPFLQERRLEPWLPLAAVVGYDVVVTGLIGIEVLAFNSSGCALGAAWMMLIVRAGSVLPFTWLARRRRVIPTARVSLFSILALFQSGLFAVGTLQLSHLLRQ